MMEIFTGAAVATLVSNVIWIITAIHIINGYEKRIWEKEKVVMKSKIKKLILAIIAFLAATGLLVFYLIFGPDYSYFIVIEITMNNIENIALIIYTCLGVWIGKMLGNFIRESKKQGE